MDIQNAELQPISGLPAATVFVGLFTIGTDSQNRSVKVPLDAIVNPPKIGENGHWYIWSLSSNGYVDSGLVSKGDTGAALTFDDLTAAQKAALQGQAGVGVQGTTVGYCTTMSDDVDLNLLEWSSSIPSVLEGHWLWTKVAISYTNGTSTVFYTKSRRASDGTNGKGISNAVVKYGLSDAQTDQPESWSDSIPTLTAGKWLWTRTVITYTDNNTSSIYNKTFIPANGTNGKSAYQQAVEGGYQGTEEQYNAYLAGLTTLHVLLTESQYAALQNPDPDKIYLTYEDE